MSKKGKQMKCDAKKYIAVVLVATTCFFGNNTLVLADDDPPKLISLGLSAATAMASEKDVVKGLKTAAADEYTNWLWEAIGGLETFMTQNTEADIPAAKDKIMNIVNTVKAIENFAIAMTEGRYDDAAFVAIDQVVGKLNHPLVSLTWEMCKLTYESHKLVQSSQAALHVETLYGMMASDRRLMGVLDPNADEPPLIPETAQSADYFFDKYVLTNDGTRQALKSYVTTVLGDEWPEQSWSDYAKSWMTVGSGVDTERSAEIEMLDSEWRNKGRTWIMKLIKEVNQQAKLAWAEARVRQQLAEFKKFSERVGHFYNNDFEQMLKEFIALKMNEKAEAELLKLPAESKKAYEALSALIAKMNSSDLKNVTKWNQTIETWQLTCLSGSSQMIRINDGLSQQLSAEWRKWLDLGYSLNKKVDSKDDTIQQELKQEMVPDRSAYNEPNDFYARADRRAREYYAQYFESLFKEFDFVAVEKKIDIYNLQGDSSTVSINGDPDKMLEQLLIQLNLGDFQGAQSMIDFWEDDVSSALNTHFVNLEAEIKKVLSITPPELIAAEEHAKKTSAQGKAMHDAIQPQIARINERISQAKSERERESLYAQINALVAPVHEFGRTVSGPAQNAYSLEKLAWERTSGAPAETLARMKGAYYLQYDAVMPTLKEAQAAFHALRESATALKQKYENDCEAILNLLPEHLLTLAADGIENHPWLAKDDIALVNSNTYTFMVPAKITGEVRARDMASVLFGIVKPAEYGYLADTLWNQAAWIESMNKVWVKAKDDFSKLRELSDDEINQIRVLVDPDFDPEAYRKKISTNIKYTEEIVAHIPNLRKAAQKAAEDEENRQRDEAFVNQKANIVNAYFEELKAQGLITMEQHDIEIVLPARGWQDMVKLAAPYPHYATRAEIDTFAQPVRDAWEKMTARSFAEKYAPQHAAKWKEIMTLSHVPVAKGDNFIPPSHDIPIYKSDLLKAYDLAKKVDVKSKKYSEEMAAIAKLVPGMMQVQSDLDKAYEEKQAKLYGMSVEEYSEKVNKGGFRTSYMLRERVQEDLRTGEGLENELGELYIKIAKRVDELAGLYRSYLADEVTAKIQAENEEEQKEKLKKAEEATMASMRASGGAVLAGFYGYNLEDRRVNTYSMQNPVGTVILTNREVRQGTISFSARLWTIDKVRALLFSTDAGRTWNELPLSQDINYTFNAMPDTEYMPMLRIQTTDSEDMSFPFFAGVDAFVWQNVDYDSVVVATVKAIAEAYERQDLSYFSRYISRDYLGNSTFLEEGVRFDFDMFTDIRLTIYVNRIEQRGNIFLADTKWDKSQTPRQTGQQQTTNGRTTMVFALEDGVMKIKNLRGNLIYATLSPEIAQASGLKQSVVDDIRTARDERNPTQPGAGETEDAGGVEESSGTLTVYSGRQTKDADNTDMNPTESFDFSLNQVVGVNDGNVAFIDEGPKFLIGKSNTTFRDSEKTFEATTSADDGTQPFDMGVDGSVGTTYVFKTGPGLYGKFQITDIQTVGIETTITFRYALQEDGSKNLAT
jgi:hypothetical protein